MNLLPFKEFTPYRIQGNKNVSQHRSHIMKTYSLKKSNSNIKESITHDFFNLLPEEIVFATMLLSKKVVKQRVQDSQ